MATKAKGKVLLSGFSLDPAEKAIVDNLIRNYQNKIAERMEFEEIKLRLRKSKHGKTFLHEIQGTLIAGKQFNAKVIDYNLFSAIAEAFEKLMNEAEHKERTARQKLR